MTVPADGALYFAPWQTAPRTWGCIEYRGGVGLTVTVNRSYDLQADLTFAVPSVSGLVRIEAVAPDGFTVRTLVEQPPQPALVLQTTVDLLANEQVRVAMIVTMVGPDMVMSAGTFSVVAAP
jgi:hypothetical protein